MAIGGITNECTASTQRVVSDVDYSKARDNVAEAELLVQYTNEELDLKHSQYQLQVKGGVLSLKQQRELVAHLTSLVDRLTILSPVNRSVGKLIGLAVLMKLACFILTYFLEKTRHSQRFPTPKTTYE